MANTIKNGKYGDEERARLSEYAHPNYGPNAQGARVSDAAEGLRMAKRNKAVDEMNEDVGEDRYRNGY